MTEHHAKRLTKEDILRAMRENKVILDRFSVKKVGLFGSFATGQQSADSDIDLLVEFERPTYDNFSGLAEQLERLFGRRVEILTPDGLDSIRVPEVAEGIRKALAYG